MASTNAAFPVSTQVAAGARDTANRAVTTQLAKADAKVLFFEVQTQRVADTAECTPCV